MNLEIAWATLLQHEVEIQAGVLAVCCCRRIGIRFAVSVPHFKSVDTWQIIEAISNAAKESAHHRPRHIKQRPAEEHGRLVSRMGMTT